MADLTGHPSFPASPSGSDSLPSLEAPSDWADNYGTRLRAFLTAPPSGAYTFWIASDDSSELRLAPDDNPAHRVLIASVSGWTSSPEWTKYPSQQSAPITLVAGGRYYVEVLHKEGGGGDNLVVGWQLPDGTLERPIPGSRLSPVDPLDGDGDGVSDADEIAAGTDLADRDSHPGAPGSDSDSGERGCGTLGMEAALFLLLRGGIRRPR